MNFVESEQVKQIAKRTKFQKTPKLRGSGKRERKISRILPQPGCGERKDKRDRRISLKVVSPSEAMPLRKSGTEERDDQAA